MSKYTLTELLRVAALLPFIDDTQLNLPMEKRVYSRALAEHLLDTEAQTGALALAERERDGVSSVVFEDEKEGLK